MLKHSWLSWWPCLVHDLFAGAAGRLGSLLHPQNPRINDLGWSDGGSGWPLQRNQVASLCSVVVLPS